MKVADRVIAMATSGTKIIPVHGPLSYKVELKVYRDMLKTVGKRIADAVAAEKSLADLQQNSPLADLDATRGNGFLKPLKFLELLYTGISQKRFSERMYSEVAIFSLVREGVLLTFRINVLKSCRRENDDGE